MPANSPASAPSSVLSGRSTAAASTVSGLAAIASIRVFPMRPAAPFTAIRVMVGYLASILHHRGSGFSRTLLHT
jgi:hypothetical protein